MADLRDELHRYAEDAARRAVDEHRRLRMVGLGPLLVSRSTTSVRAVKIWTDAWEWQCCGEPFAVGAEVEWGLTAVSAEARSFLAEPLGTEIVDQLTHFETHHGGATDETDAVLTRGRVESIQAVYWQRAPRSGADPRVVYPIAGTALLKARETANGWEPEDDRDKLGFEGYIVELSPLR